MGFSPWGHKEDTTEQLSTAQQHMKVEGMWASLVAQLVKNPPAMQGTLVQFVGWEISLEKG